MAKIEVSLVSDADPMRFSITVRQSGSRSEHEVTASKRDVERLARVDETPETFVGRCFDFLLAREPKESIMKEFDITVIPRYFPEFEDEIAR